MTSKITGMSKCLKIGALICCLTICAIASGHYCAVQPASTEDAIVTNEEGALRVEGIEQVAGLSFDISKTDLAMDISEETEARTVVMISAASGAIKDEVSEAVVKTEEAVVLEEEVPEETEPEVSEKYENLAVTTVKADWLNIREDASSDAEIVGKLYPGAAGEILEESEGWTKISSGSVTGWVSDEYLVKRIDAQNAESEYGKAVAMTDTDGLRVRSSASTEAKVLGSVDEGKKYKVLSIADEWLEINFEGESGFISAEYASVEYTYKDAISLEEERAIKAEEERRAAEKKAAEERAAAEKAAADKKITIATTTGSGIALSEEDIILMGAVIQNEAGGSSYENMLAVANVILNRVRSGRWGSSVSSVIYAKGQFSGANTGRIDSIVAAGPRGTCIQAARDAAAGTNNIGNIMFFCATSIMDPDRYSSYVVIGDNCFYVR